MINFCSYVAYHVYQENLISEISCIVKESFLHGSKETSVPDGCACSNVNFIALFSVYHGKYNNRSWVTSSFLAERLVISDQCTLLREP